MSATAAVFWCLRVRFAPCLVPHAPQVFLSALARSRQMQQLGQQQLPRGGAWSRTHARTLRALEKWALNPTAAASAAAANTATASAAGAVRHSISTTYNTTSYQQVPVQAGMSAQASGGPAAVGNTHPSVANHLLGALPTNVAANAVAADHTAREHNQPGGRSGGGTNGSSRRRTGGAASAQVVAGRDATQEDDVTLRHVVLSAHSTSAAIAGKATVGGGVPGAAHETEYDEDGLR